MKKNYYSYNQYLRQTFGERVQRLSLDAGFSCPNLDGTLSSKGCSFCNNKAFSYYVSRPTSLANQIEKSILFARKRYKAKKFIAYFQSFTSTYADLETLRKRYAIIKKYPDIVGICLSTRPDFVDKEKLKLLNKFSVSYKVYIEYGLQTAHDKTLKKINRNHTFAAFENALSLTLGWKNIHPAAHIILGLPGETEAEMLATGKILAKMPLWGLKIHCLHVLRGTALFSQYKKKKVKLFSKKEYLKILIKFIRLIPKNLVILRLISDADPGQLIAPKWLNKKTQALQELDKLLQEKKICQGDCFRQTS